MNSDPKDSGNLSGATAPGLGAFLRSERERRSLTLEQVASATRINLRVLQSLESDEYDSLPAKPFVRGFILSYARFIGLDGKEILLRWDPFLDVRMAGSAEKSSGLSGYAFDRREGGEQSRTYLSVIMGVVVVVGGLGLLIFKPVGRHSSHSKLDQLKEAPVTVASAEPDPTTQAVEPEVISPMTSPSATVASMDAIIASPSPSPSSSLSPRTLSAVSVEPSPIVTPSLAPQVSPSVTPNELTSATPDPAPSINPMDPLSSGVGIYRAKVKQRVILKALADVWVRYQSDDRPSMKFVLRKGRVLVLRAESKLVVQVSNPRALTANVNFGKDKEFSAVPSTFQSASGATWAFAESKLMGELKANDPFSGQSSLPKTQDPPPASDSDAISR